jgi:adenine-specific DNA methylase
MNKFLQDPYGALQDGLTPIIEERAKAIVQEVMQQQQAQQWEAQQQAELAAYDKQYHDLYFDKFGQLNQLGQVWNHHYTQARQHGLPDPIAHAHRIAMAWEAEQSVASAPPPKTATEQEAEQKLKFLKQGAKRTKNRGGAQGKAGRSVAATSGGDPWKKLEDRFRAMPDEAFDMR